MIDEKDEYIHKLENYISELEAKLESIEESIEKPTKENTIWKIRNKKTGLWSRGGQANFIGGRIHDGVNWTKQGKVWKQRGAVTNHIRQHTYGALPSHLHKSHDSSDLLPYVNDWEVVPFSTFEGAPCSINQWWFEHLLKSAS